MKTVIGEYSKSFSFDLLHLFDPVHPNLVAAVAQLAECVLGKDEVMGSSPISSFARRSGWRMKQKREHLLPACRRQLNALGDTTRQRAVPAR